METRPHRDCHGIERRDASECRLRDKKVLLTGGAGGLGTAITLAFSEAGARVLALDVDRDKGERLLAECGAAGATPGTASVW